MARDENIIDYVFRARDAKKVQDAADQIKESLEDLEPAADKSSDALDDMQDRLDEFARSEDDASKSTQSFFDKIKGGDIGKLAVGFAAAQVAVAAFDKVLRSLQSSFDFTIGKAAQQETAVVALENAFVSAGTFSRKASSDFQEFASAMQAVTAAGDEEVLSLGALIAQIGKLRGGELERATKAALDMQAALGKTSQEVGIFLGKLAQGESGSLTEIGIVIDQTLPKSEKFLAGLEAIENAFGGTAQAKVLTYAGAIQQSANAFGDLGEAIGERFLPGLTQAARLSTSVFASMADNIRGMAAQTEHSLPEMATIFELQTAAIRGSVGKMKQDLEEGLKILTEKADSELRLTVRTGDLDEVLETLESLDDVIERSTSSGSKAFQEMVDGMRAAVQQEFEIRVRLEAANIGADLANLTNALTPEVGLDVLLSGTDQFRDALNLANGLRSAVERPLQFGAVQEPIDLVKLDQDIKKAKASLDELLARPQFVNDALQFEANIEIEAARQKLVQLQEDYEVARKRLEEAFQTGEVSVKLSGESDLADQAREFVDRLGPAVEREGLEVVAAAKLKIDAAATVEELAATLRDLESRFIEAVGRAETQPSQRNIAVRDALKEANEQAKALAVIREETLRLKAESDAAAPAIDRVAAALVKLQQLTGVATTSELIDTDKLVRGTTDVTAANENLVSSIDKLVEAGDIKALAAAYLVLQATIKASEDGVAGLDDKMRQTFEEQLLRVEAFIKALEPLERLELNVDLNLGKTKDKSKKESKEIVDDFNEQFERISLDAAGGAIDVFWDTAISAFDTGATTAEERITRMVDSMLKELLRLAAFKFFSLLFSGGTSAAPGAFLGGPFGAFVGNRKPTLGDGGGPSTGASSSLDGFSVRQLTDATVRPLEKALQAIQLQNQVLVAQQPIIPPEAARQVVPFVEDDARRTVIHANIQALDSADFERYMRDGPGRRAFNALASQGRL